MSKNPYHSAGDYGDDFDRYDTPPRTSLLAVFSILCAIPCCIPGAGLIAATLGGVSLAFIRSARGRLTGRTAAIVGIFLGVFVTVIQVALGIGIMQAWTYYAKTMMPTAQTFFVSAAQGDYANARTVLTTEADQAVTDDEIDLFIEAAEMHVGDIQSLSADLGFLFESFGNIYSGGSSPPQTSNQNNMTVAPIPFALETSTGSAVVVAVFEGKSLDTHAPKLIDAMILIPGVRAVALRPDGPATIQGAPAYGVKVLTPQEAIDAAEAERSGAIDAEPDSTDEGAEAPLPEEEPVEG